MLGQIQPHDNKGMLYWNVYNLTKCYHLFLCSGCCEKEKLDLVLRWSTWEFYECIHRLQGKNSVMDRETRLKELKTLAINLKLLLYHREWLVILNCKIQSCGQHFDMSTELQQFIKNTIHMKWNWGFFQDVTCSVCCESSSHKLEFEDWHEESLSNLTPTNIHDL